MEEELANTIEIVADQLGIAVEHIYGTFVSAQLVIGIIDAVSIVVGIFATVVFAKVAYKLLKSYMSDDDGKWDADGSPVMATAFSIMAAATFAMVFSLLVHGVKGALLKIFCPEYSAIREILSLVMGA